MNANTGEIQRNIEFVQDVSSKEKEKLNKKFDELQGKNLFFCNLLRHLADRWSAFGSAKEEETVAALELERDGLQADKQAQIDQAENDKLEFENIQKEIETKEKTKIEVNQ